MKLTYLVIAIAAPSFVETDVARLSIPRAFYRVKMPVVP